MTKNLILDLILACLAPVWAPNFFLWVLSLLDVRHCRKLSSFVISRITYDPNSRKYQKLHFGPELGPLGSFSELWLLHSLNIMVSYQHVQY